jgi:cytochrome c553
MIRNRKKSIAFLVLVGLFFSLKTSFADEVQQSDQAALLAASCSGCHTQNNGDGDDDGNDIAIPELNNLSAEQIRNSFRTYREHEESTVMSRIAKGFSEEKINLLADYLGQQVED